MSSRWSIQIPFVVQEAMDAIREIPELEAPGYFPKTLEILRTMPDDGIIWPGSQPANLYGPREEDSMGERVMGEMVVVRAFWARGIDIRVTMKGYTDDDYGTSWSAIHAEVRRRPTLAEIQANAWMELDEDRKIIIEFGGNFFEYVAARRAAASSARHFAEIRRHSALVAASKL